jgi:ribulose 1,5-bisphosphate synthetase/thiazole synthase
MHSGPNLLGLCLATVSFLAGDALSDGSCGTLHVDVAVVGGGASGAYAAVRLKEDYNKTIVLIEKERRLVSFFSSLLPF